MLGKRLGQKWKKMHGETTVGKIKVNLLWSE